MLQFKSPIKINKNATFNIAKCKNCIVKNKINITYRVKEDKNSGKGDTYTETNTKEDHIYNVITNLKEKLDIIESKATSITSTLFDGTTPTAQKNQSLECPDLFVKDIQITYDDTGLQDLEATFENLKQCNKISLMSYQEQLRGIVQNENMEICGGWFKILDFIIVVFKPNIPDIGSIDDKYYTYYLFGINNVEDYSVFNFGESTAVLNEVQFNRNSNTEEFDSFYIKAPHGTVEHYRGLTCEYIVILQKKSPTVIDPASSTLPIQQYSFGNDEKARYEQKYMK